MSAILKADRDGLLTGGSPVEEVRLTRTDGLLFDIRTDVWAIRKAVQAGVAKTNSVMARVGSESINDQSYAGAEGGGHRHCRGPHRVRGVEDRHRRRLDGHRRARDAQRALPSAARQRGDLHRRGRFLKRMKDDVREVAEGFECGIKLKNVTDIKEGDQLEFFEVKEVARTL